MKDADEDYVAAARQWWRTAKQDHPVATTIAEILPVTGQLASIADYADHLEEGDTAGAVMDAVQFIPGVKLLKQGSKLAPALVRVGMKPAERALDPVVKHSRQISAAGNAADISEGASEFSKEWGRLP